MVLFASKFSRQIIALCLILCLPVLAFADESKDRIAVIPISDSSPAGMNAAQSAAGKIEIMLNQLSDLTVLEASTVASTVRQIHDDDEIGPTWQDVASELSLDYAILLSAGPAMVEYLGEEFDHLSVGELDGKPGKVYLYEGAVTLRATIKYVETSETLLDKEVTGKEVERFRQSHDTAKYAMIIAVVRELAAIVDDSTTRTDQGNISEEHLALLNEALAKAVKKLERPIRRTLK